MNETKYRYGLISRPPSSFSLPKLPWTLVAHGTDSSAVFPRRPDLPTSNRFMFGEIEFDQQLTDAQLERFGLEPV